MTNTPKYPLKARCLMCGRTSPEGFAAIRHHVWCVFHGSHVHRKPS